MVGRSWRFGSVAANVLLPWFLLLIIVAALIGYRFQQNEDMDAMEAQSRLNGQAVHLAHDLRYQALARWSSALNYQLKPDKQILEEFRESQIETQQKIDELEGVFIAGGGYYDTAMSRHAQELLASYRVVREGQAELYEQLFQEIENGNVSQVKRVIKLLGDKILLVRSALDDLMAYHIKAEALVDAKRYAMRERADLLFFGLLSALILFGLIFSRYQTRAIVRPLTELTHAAQKIGAGEAADLTRFKGKGEIGQLSEALTQMVEALRRAHHLTAMQKDQLALAYADIELTVEQRTAQLQRRTEELETANNDLEGFSYSVSHDLRAPLRAIDGFVAILSEDYGPQLDAEGLRLFGIVQQNAQKMGSLIDDILEFSRAGRLALQPVPVDMNVLVDEVWAELAEQCDERPIEFCRDELPPVAGDAGALRQVWQNLLSNAIKFSRNSDPARITVSAEAQDQDVWFEVKDNGAGFNQDYQGKLFTLFLRLHGMDEFEGTGVGLAIVKRFVQKHGGRVTAEGTVGAGACFRFSLPANPPQALSEKE